MSFSIPLTPLLRPLPLLRARRAFSTTLLRHSHIGSSPLPIPSSITLLLPALSVPPNSLTPRSITIRGPLGEKSLPLPPAVILAPPTEGNGNTLTLSVHDATVQEQRAVWGLTRALLNNSVIGVSEGFRLVIRLVGVGYRAAVEPIPATLLSIRLPPRSRPSSSSSSSFSERAAPTHRLNLKLGYAHPILIPIPPSITVTTPTPTRIVLAGGDKQGLGLFGARVRRWRKPEPYRGKGIFVGEETIKLKEIKKK